MKGTSFSRCLRNRLNPGTSGIDLWVCPGIFRTCQCESDAFRFAVHTGGS